MVNTKCPVCHCLVKNCKCPGANHVCTTCRERGTLGEGEASTCCPDCKQSTSNCQCCVVCKRIQGLCTCCKICRQPQEVCEGCCEYCQKKPCACQCPTCQLQDSFCRCCEDCESYPCQCPEPCRTDLTRTVSLLQKVFPAEDKLSVLPKLSTT